MSCRWNMFYNRQLGLLTLPSPYRERAGAARLFGRLINEV
jgi:hypothetical protein